MEDKTTMNIRKDITKFFVVFLKEFGIYTKIVSRQSYKDTYNRILKLFLACETYGKYFVLTRLFHMTIFNSAEEALDFDVEEAAIYDILYKIYLLKNIQIMHQLNITVNDPSTSIVNQIKDLISSPIIIFQTDLTDKLVEVMETESKLLLKYGITPLTKDNLREL